MPDTAESTSAEANHLYWETEHSVADIAQQLDISRRALYAAVEPLPIDRNCETCGGTLVYENRSARSSDAPVCPACTDTAQDENGSDTAIDESALSGLRPQAGVIVGAALAGAALGAAMTLAVVRRR